MKRIATLLASLILALIGCTPASPAAAATTWREDFSRPVTLGQVGNIYGQSMRGYDGFADTRGHGLYAPDRVLSVHGGVLDYYLHSEGGRPLVAAPTLIDYAGKLYGTFSVSVKADAIPGYKIAFLLWPSSDDWNDGEVDWPEVSDLSSGAKASPASAIAGSAAAHGYQRADFLPATRAYSPVTMQSGYHTYTIRWLPTSLTFLIDSTTVATITSGIPQTPMRWTLQAETQIGAAPSSSARGHVYIDWASYQAAG